jgi:hypothetical protein
MNRLIPVTAAVPAMILAASGSVIAAPQTSDPGGAAANRYLQHPVIVGPTNPYLKEPGAGRAPTNPYLQHPVIVGPTNPYLKEPGTSGTNGHR